VSETEAESGVFDHDVEARRPLPDPPDETKPVADSEPEPVQAEQPRPVPEAPERPAVETPPDEQHAEGGISVPAGVRVFGGSANGARRSVAIAVSKFNGEITSRLLGGALEELEARGVVREAIDVMPVPGAFELPLAAMALAKSRRYSCVLALGCVIRGETSHFDFVSAEAASGVQLAGLETGVPVSFGVLTCDTGEQALARAGGGRGNKGTEAARSALEMVDALAQLRATLAS
jgi:6,7-dimethyl-8-ribityllumazine synthase